MNGANRARRARREPSGEFRELCGLRGECCDVLLQRSPRNTPEGSWTPRPWVNATYTVVDSARPTIALRKGRGLPKADAVQAKSTVPAAMKPAGFSSTTNEMRPSAIRQTAGLFVRGPADAAPPRTRRTIST